MCILDFPGVVRTYIYSFLYIFVEITPALLLIRCMIINAMGWTREIGHRNYNGNYNGNYVVTRQSIIQWNLMIKDPPRMW